MLFLIMEYDIVIEMTFQVLPASWCAIFPALSPPGSSARSLRAVISSHTFTKH